MTRKRGRVAEEEEPDGGSQLSADGVPGSERRDVKPPRELRLKSLSFSLWDDHAAAGSEVGLPAEGRGAGVHSKQGLHLGKDWSRRGFGRASA